MKFTTVASRRYPTRSKSLTRMAELQGIFQRQSNLYIANVREIKIDRGVEEGQKIVYKELGNEAAGFTSSNLIFIIHELPHPTFKRKGNDMVYIARISLGNAISADPIQIVTLDNRKLQTPVD